jgi:transcriptional regulator with XRE-family HTH domain
VVFLLQQRGSKMPRRNEGKFDKKFNKHLGQAIRARRELLGMTQKCVAKKLDITFQQLQKYEVGDNTIPMSRLKQISQILETSFLKYMEQELPEYDYRIIPADRINSIVQSLKNELLRS